ncbi:hypothetical protein, conserved [Trypanosoma brucei gambiense DAL972]|uniref:Methyltransferase n=1 Tax=Trypanosoma brucei gambiense (strain MHOM/CI/86/DAL972) TaxID=679716 RepID=D0A895_TRYB9|nr:hypothetical protein, conserved [Trypanosoma brucei gambiense DAL972]CBH17896.1 hypothetical protein, conserved [Trypanosoma brucei gambiense DAL972]|eukprot:XP_011780160.1 hypothetical protein, conserved [Trypanosoma brucei gambiense DAL972]
MPLPCTPHPPVSLLLFLQSAPPQKTFDAFIEDCKLCGMSWCSPAAQQLCVALIIRNPLVKKYPPRPSNIYAFLKHFIFELEQIHSGTAGAEDPDGEDPIHQDLMEAYIEYMELSGRSDQKSFCYRTYFDPNASEKYVSVRLAVGQFTNVGLALWPSAFVLVQLLARELSEPSPSVVPFPLEGELRLLELGAGVGLLPLLLKRQRAYEDRVCCCILTEYQQELVDNITFNLALQDIVVAEAVTSDTPNSGGPLHAVALLDWREHEQNQVKLRNWGCNLILAADCVYDVSLIQPFVRTLHDALSATNGCGGAVVVQTHRQRETIQRLFAVLEEAGLSVCSYRLACGVPSAGRSHDITLTFPRSVSVHTGDGSVCCFALERDEVNPSGIFKGLEGIENSVVSGWIGPFFTSMEAVVGVHVIRLRSIC